MLTCPQVWLVLMGFSPPHRENSEEGAKAEASGDGVEQPPAAEEAGEGEDNGSKGSEDKQEDDET